MADLDYDLVDKRVQERNMRRGVLAKKDFEKYLDGLKDVGDNAEVVELPVPGEQSGDAEDDQE